MRELERHRTWWVFALVVAVGGGPSPASAQGGTSAGEAAQRKEGELTQPPKLEREVEAEYTEEALEAGVEGTVRLKIEIDRKGDVARAEVVEGLGHGLDEAARRAVKQFEFRPAEIDGEPAPVVLSFEIEFTLPKRPATFRGRLLGADAGDPLSGVVVRIEYTGDQYEKAPKAETSTGAEGRFRFGNVPPGTYRVELRAPEYRARQTEVTLGSNETVEAEYQLARKPVVLSGTIREAGTRDPLAGVRVRIRDGEDDELVREVYTDGEGAFAVRGLEPGQYRIQLDAEGYDDSVQIERLRKNKRLKVRYYLEADYYDEFSVRTTAKRESETVDRKTLQLEEIRRIPGSGGDAVRSIQNLPGVARPSFASGQLIVRGSTPQSTKTFIEGDEIPLIYHFLGGPSVISSEMIEAIDFYPGNYRARYGRALAGIVDLQTRPPKTDRIHGFTEVDVIDATAQLEGPINDELSFAVSGRRSYIDAILPALLPDDGPSLRVAPRYYDYQGWLSWKPSDEHRFEFFLYGSNDRLEALFDEDDPQGNAQIQVTGLELNNGFHKGQARWEWRPPKLPVENDAMISFGWNQFGFEAADNLFFRLRYIEAQLRDDFRWDVVDQIQVNTGVDTQIGRTQYSAQVPGFDSSGASDPGSSRSGQQPNFGDQGILAEGRTDWIVQPAVYTDVEFEPVEDLMLIPGLRVDYFEGVDEFAESPRFNARWQITDMFAAKGGVGLFTQPPDPGQTSPEFGNPRLTYQRASQYSVGGIVSPLDFLQFDATVFYRKLEDLVVPTDEVRIDSATGRPEPVIYSNAGVGRAYGLELLARHYPANKVFGWVAYTLSRSERRDLETGEWNVFEYDQTHNLTAVAGYNLPWNVDISARFRLVTGNPETPVVGSVWNADADEYVPIYGEPNSLRSDTFHQLDLRVDKEFIFNTWRLGVFVDVINVYNAKNEEGKRYNYDYSQQGSINGLPLIPTLGVNARF